MYSDPLGVLQSEPNRQQKVEPKETPKSVDKVKVVGCIALVGLGAVAIVFIVLALHMGDKMLQWFQDTGKSVAQFASESYQKTGELAKNLSQWMNRSVQVLGANVPNWTWFAAGGGLLAFVATGLGAGLYLRKRLIIEPKAAEGIKEPLFRDSILYNEPFDLSWFKG